MNDQGFIAMFLKKKRSVSKKQLLFHKIIIPVRLLVNPCIQ